MKTECRSELALRARRDQLSSSERAALTAHLASCESCRLSHRLGRDFDDSDPPVSTDASRITRLAALAEQWANQGQAPPAPRVVATLQLPPQRRRRPQRILALAALVLVVAGTAAAMRFARSEPEPLAPKTGALAPSNPPEAAVRRQPPATSARAELPPETPPEEPAVKSPVRSTVSRAAPSSAPESVPPSARELFERAHAARRSGKTREAIAAFLDLQRHHRGSPEAVQSQVALGNAWLQVGDARAALQQFDAYLAGGARRSLAPEALYGRGRCLATLGNRAEEARTWQRLLTHYAGSPYAAHARRRLEDLRAEPAVPGSAR